MDDDTGTKGELARLWASGLLTDTEFFTIRTALAKRAAR
jgi:hypothetical protein